MTKQEIMDLIRATAIKYNVPPEAALEIARRESGFNPTAQNPIKGATAGGIFQFIDSTWEAYGGGANKHDPAANIDAGIRFISDNANSLRRAGFEVTPGTLYLAHANGPGGAINILSNPNARAVDTVGERALTWNGGDLSWTNAQLADFWMSKMNGSGSPSRGTGGDSAGRETPFLPEHGSGQEGQALSPAEGLILGLLEQEAGSREKAKAAAREQELAAAIEQMSRQEEEQKRRQDVDRQGLGALFRSSGRPALGHGKMREHGRMREAARGF